MADLAQISFILGIESDPVNVPWTLIMRMGRIKIERLPPHSYVKAADLAVI